MESRCRAGEGNYRKDGCERCRVCCRCCCGAEFFKARCIVEVFLRVNSNGATIASLHMLWDISCLYEESLGLLQSPRQRSGSYLSNWSRTWAMHRLDIYILWSAKFSLPYVFRYLTFLHPHKPLGKVKPQISGPCSGYDFRFRGSRGFAPDGSKGPN